MADARLILHVDSTAKTLQELEAMPMPLPMGSRHIPTHPAKFVKALVRAVEAYGFQITKNQIGATENGERVFGAMDLTHPDLPVGEGRGYSLGYRNSTDQRLSRGLVGGNRVFVCDNLALSGDMILLRGKNTNDRLVDAFEEGLDKFQVASKMFNQVIEMARATQLSKTLSESLLWQVFSKGIMPKKLMKDVDNVYRERPEATGVQGDSLFDLHNAFTYVLKGEDSVSRWQKTMKLGKFLTDVLKELRK